MKNEINNNESSQATTLNLQHGDAKMKNEEWIAYVVALCNKHFTLEQVDTPFGYDLDFDFVYSDEYDKIPSAPKDLLTRLDCEGDEAPDEIAAEYLLKKETLSSEEAKFLRLVWFTREIYKTLERRMPVYGPSYWRLIPENMRALESEVEKLMMKEISPVDRYPESLIMRDDLYELNEFFDSRAHEISEAFRKGAYLD